MVKCDQTDMVFTAYITLRNGNRLYAKQVGKMISSLLPPPFCYDSISFYCSFLTCFIFCIEKGPVMARSLNFIHQLITVIFIFFPFFFIFRYLAFALNILILFAKHHKRNFNILTPRLYNQNFILHIIFFN